MFTDFTIQVCSTCPVLRARENDGRCLIVCRLERGGWTLEVDILSGCKLMLRVILKSAAALSVGIPSVARSPAIRRGSDGVEDRLGCCLT